MQRTQLTLVLIVVALGCCAEPAPAEAPRSSPSLVTPTPVISPLLGDKAGSHRGKPLLAFTGSAHDESDPNYTPNDGIDTEIWILYEDGSLENVTNNDAMEFEPSWSPDGRTLSYTCPPTNGEFIGTYDADICVIDLRSGATRRITSRPGAEGSGEWSPNGRWIYFSWIRRRGVDVYRVRPTGGEWQRVTSGGPDEYSIALSPSGDRIAFSTVSGDIHVMNSDGSGQERLTSGRAYADDSPTWSPDGDWLAFVRQANDETGDTQIYKVSSIGAEVVRVSDVLLGAKYPAWSPEGKHIAFAYGGNFDIVAVPADGGSIERLTRGPREDLHPSWAPRAD